MNSEYEQYERKLDEWEAEGYDVSEFRERWFPSRKAQGEPSPRYSGAEPQLRKFRKEHKRELQRLAVIQEEIREHKKSMNVTTLLAVLLGGILLCGFGHIYVGRIGKGLAFLFADLAVGIVTILLFMQGALPLCFIFGAGNLALWIWQIVDARRLCREHNRQITTKYE